MKHKKFSYKSLEELKKDMELLNLNFPIDDDISVLREEVKEGDKVIPNRFVIHPMEGADANSDGTPGELI